MGQTIRTAVRGRSFIAMLTLLVAGVSGCSKHYELARIEAGQGRSIFILAERYPDQNQPVFYRVEVNGQVVVPNTYISSLDSPIKDSNFKLLSDKSGSVVGVVEQKLPQKIWLLHNFVTGETYPRCDSGGMEECEKRGEALLNQLQRDHPEIIFVL